MLAFLTGLVGFVDMGKLLSTPSSAFSNPPLIGLGTVSTTCAGSPMLCVSTYNHIDVMSIDAGDIFTRL